MARIHAALRQAPFTGKHPVPAELQADIRWFLKFAERSNGLTLLQHKPRLPWVIECDSSLARRGAHSPTSYYGQAYPHALAASTTNIAHLEAINLLIALRALVPPNTHEFHITINTDNAASQQVLENGTGRDNTLTAFACEITSQ